MAAITGMLGFAHLRQSGAFQPEPATAAAVWGTVALFRAQQGEYTARRRLVEELRDFHGELALRRREARMLAERARIARKIHASLAQEPYGSRMLLQAAECDRRRSPEPSWARIRAVEETLGENLADTRGLVNDLTPSALDTHDLQSALRALCSPTQRFGIKCSATPPRASFHDAPGHEITLVAAVPLRYADRWAPRAGVSG
ncbi:sensor histidine kinase [Streptomyces sp. NPDC057474]|uniref:sensor histidine kinase n=1 Tax=Streptomyces sp. NPDC057474 TaxID=3346144 RepID=UPI00369C5099